MVEVRALARAELGAEVEEATDDVLVPDEARVEARNVFRTRATRPEPVREPRGKVPVRLGRKVEEAGREDLRARQAAASAVRVPRTFASGEHGCSNAGFCGVLYPELCTDTSG
jgi:hypothetical protein